MKTKIEKVGPKRLEIWRNITFGNHIGDIWTNQPYFGVWLFELSKCNWIAKRSNKTDSWYQDYSVLLAAASPSCHQQPAAFVPETARNI